MSNRKKTLLIVAAHPDDEILGCGGTIARMSDEGHDIYTLILGEGVTSRDETRQREKREGSVKKLRKEAAAANKIIGVKKVIFRDFPDNRFDTIPLLDIIKEVEKVKDKIRPDTIFTHYAMDLNIDHRITFGAVMTASRPVAGETVREIYSFETPSSTEWNYPNVFNPNVFFDIEETIDRKIEALKKYGSELRQFPHPRSLEAVKTSARRWGSRTGLKYAEAFELARYVG